MFMKPPGQYLNSTDSLWSSRKNPKKKIFQMSIYLMLLPSIWPGEIKYTREIILYGSHVGVLGISKLL